MPKAAPRPRDGRGAELLPAVVAIAVTGKKGSGGRIEERLITRSAVIPLRSSRCRIWYRRQSQWCRGDIHQADRWGGPAAVAAVDIFPGIAVGGGTTVIG